MPRSRPPYPAEFRCQMVDLVRSGRSPDHLAREFEPSAQSIRNWVVQGYRDEGRRDVRRGQILGLVPLPAVYSAAASRSAVLAPSLWIAATTSTLFGSRSQRRVAPRTAARTWKAVSAGSTSARISSAS